MNEEITKKEIAAFALIVVAMLGCLAYGFFLLKGKQNPAPTPTHVSCWEQYKDAGEEIAIQMCEGKNE